MQPYGNRSGNSGIAAYEFTPDGIKVQFVGGAVYLYTEEDLGQQTIEELKRLAADGRGLATYISRYVKTGYAARLD